MSLSPQSKQALLHLSMCGALIVTIVVLARITGGIPPLAWQRLISDAGAHIGVVPLFLDAIQAGCIGVAWLLVLWIAREVATTLLRSTRVFLAERQKTAARARDLLVGTPAPETLTTAAPLGDTAQWTAAPVTPTHEEQPGTPEPQVPAGQPSAARFREWEETHPDTPGMSRADLVEQLLLETVPAPPPHASTITIEPSPPVTADTSANPSLPPPVPEEPAPSSLPPRKPSVQERLEAHYQAMRAAGVPLEAIRIEALRTATHVKRETVMAFLRDKRAAHQSTLTAIPLAPAREEIPDTPQQEPDLPALRTYSLSKIGDTHESNEDMLLVLTQGQRGLFAVADGMGGQAHGEEASSLAISTLNDLLGPALGEETEERCRDLLVAATQQANTAIFQRNQQATAGRMGTTLTAAFVARRHAYIVNVGDSRTYWQSHLHGLVRVTRDHSIVETLVAQGAIPPSERFTHPRRNEIFRSLGETAQVEVDAFFVELEPGERLLLCSDGLWELLQDPEQLARFLQAQASLEQIGQQLLHLARAERTHADDSTLILVEVV